MNRAGLRHAARGAAAVAACLLVACGAASVEPAPPKPLMPAPGERAAAAAVPDKQALIDAIGGAACTTDAQCRTVAVGRKSCGGPQAYLPFSTQATDPQRLQALAEQYTQAQSQADAGRASTCSVVTDPGAACIQQRCGLRTGLPLK